MVDLRSKLFALVALAVLLNVSCAHSAFGNFAPELVVEPNGPVEVSYDVPSAAR